MFPNIQLHSFMSHLEYRVLHVKALVHLMQEGPQGIPHHSAYQHTVFQWETSHQSEKQSPKHNVECILDIKESTYIQVSRLQIGLCFKSCFKTFQIYTVLVS
jgi:hypothetical protein